MQQTQAALQQQPQQQPGVPISKLPFQLNALPSQEQQQQMLHFQQQQQFQGQYGFGPTANNAMHQLMQPGLNSSGTLDARGNKQGNLEGNPSDGLGKSAARHVNSERE